MSIARRIFLALSVANLWMLCAQPKSEAGAEGFRLFAQGNYRQAAPLLEAAIAAAPDQPELARALGLCYLRLQNAAGARTAFARLFGVPPDSGKARLLTAKMMMGESLEEMAEPELRAVVKMEPNLPEAHYMLGELSIYRGDTDTGIAELQKEISINPAFAMAYYRLGDALTRKEQWDQAVAPLERAIWLSPEFSSPYILLGKAYYRTGRLSFAQGMLKKALSIDPKNRGAHYLLATVYREMGRQEDARQELEIWKQLKEAKEK